ncbi:MAG: 50S ribosomal protein L9 [Kiritimatiellaeota bacterium]|nr:50S ribosomal protein L9 [Kiritimatiellota bacterium]
MPVELVLLEDVKDLGQLGDRVRVADGYARNYLVPKKLAAPLTPTVLQQLEARKLRLQKEYEERVAVARAMADKLSRQSLTIAVQADEEDKLYGSVGPQQIVQALAEEGIEVERHAVQLEEPIRELGVYSVQLRLHPEIESTVKVWVVRA